MNKPNINHAKAQGSGGRQAPLKSDRYLKIVYSDERRPKSDYNFKLARYLTNRHFCGSGRLLDIGCGRGDMLRGFASAGHQVSGVDISPDVAEYCEPFDAKVVDLEGDSAPYPKNSFDFVFSKSVIEHVRDPMQLLETAYELLVPGGIAVIMTPSWLHHAWGPFYLDYTHVTPFTAPSLSDAMQFADFEDVAVSHFRQLPFLWSYPWLHLPIWAFSKLPLPYEPMYQMLFDWPRAFNNLIRFSKEAMLLGVGRKPNA